MVIAECDSSGLLNQKQEENQVVGFEGVVSLQKLLQQVYFPTCDMNFVLF